MNTGFFSIVDAWSHASRPEPIHLRIDTEANRIKLVDTFYTLSWSLNDWPKVLGALPVWDRWHIHVER